MRVTMRNTVVRSMAKTIKNVNNGQQTIGGY